MGRDVEAVVSVLRRRAGEVESAVVVRAGLAEREAGWGFGGGP